MRDSDIDKYREIKSEIEKNSESSFSMRDRYIYLKKILERVCIDFTENDSLQFPTLFSRIVYIAKKFNLTKKQEWGLQNIRVKASFLMKDSNNIIAEYQLKKAEAVLSNFVDSLFGINSTNQTETIEESSEKEVEFKKVINKNYKRVQVINIDSEKFIIDTISIDNEDDIIQIRYNVKNVNDIFNEIIDLIWINAQINIINYNIDSYGIYIPKIIVLEPDYLIDTSAISECFQSYGHSHLHYYLRKFSQISNSQHILLGNLANYFLDELIYTKDTDNLSFKDSFIEAFKQKPFEFTSCSDISNITDFKTFMSKSNTQFTNIKRVVNSDFKTNDIDINSCSLEPSFFCEKYGFQGRLDLLQTDYDTNKDFKIIELKSGGLPYPKTDVSKISINHAVQATIYRLIIESAFDLDRDKSNISTAIMYSAAENLGQNLRYVAPFQKLEKEIINVRNKIIATEYGLYTDNGSSEKLLQQICNLGNYGNNVPSFFIQQIQDFEKGVSQLSELERSYLYRYITFISRELYIQKIGDNNYDSYNSISSLWCTEFIERQESFDLISDLEIDQIDDSGRDLKISFWRKGESDFVNFREGELCILYPHKDVYDTVLSNQIMKGTISKITKDRIYLRFRYKQKNKKYFEIHKLWAVEHDRLDHSHNNMYKSLFQFFKSPIEKRNLILGNIKPRSEIEIHLSDKENIKKNKELVVIQKAIAAKDYFLIVGPPGTGKTSIYARQLIEHYYNNTSDNILIIAYTNRAVDELCETINKAFNVDNQSCNKYIRIGTELSCDPKYRHRLLQKISSGVKNREELKQTIKDQRIVVGTLASIIGKPELFEIKHFNISIIDEASQILEPQIVGILPKVDKFIMIGDHKQLSTITLQNKTHSIVNNPLLNIIRLYDCSESLFERLYRLCEENNWIECYETLVYQGRMHNDIARFPNKYFYNNILLPASDWQGELLYFEYRTESNFSEICSEKRIHFFDIQEDNTILNDKINYAEAELVTDLCKTIVDLYKANRLEIEPDKTIGIITPFRNQIALIRHKLNETNIAELQNIMIDTVERFQGSQRDIIIFSFCINKQYQLKSLINLNNDGSVDRKLNVALTRARKQLFLIGNKNILSHNSLYKQLIDFIESI